MGNNYSMSEIIDLIFYFRTAPAGIHKDDIDEEPYIRQFIEDGYADEGENEWYEVNQAGDEFMHSYIKSISDDMIQFINAKGREVAWEKLSQWFIQKYEYKYKDDVDTLLTYFLRNLRRYGYKYSRSITRNKIYIQPI